MEQTWFSGVSDELARCVTDAQACAAACETLLASMRDSEDDDWLSVLRTVVPPAAIARVLVDLIDQPPQFLAACKLFRDSAREAIDRLVPLDRAETSAVISALRTSAASCGQLLDAAA